MDQIITAETVKPGQIFSYSWGCEQTNVYWFEMMAISKTRKSATFRRLESIKTLSAPLSMEGNTVPDVGNYMISKKPFRKILKSHKGDLYIGMEYGCLRAWDGKPKRYSSYA